MGCKYSPTNPVPFSIRPEKQKAHVSRFSGNVGFGISFCTEVLVPQQPQARNVMFATATAVAATTHGLASHSHHFRDYVDWFAVSMASFSNKNTDSNQQLFGCK
jgi:hypothetical protein